ncbi:unnamed protein product [Thelazia callipaeda]|uniref:Mesoderm induction early response protein 1 n=1 Tax=Thelazia callipaeda TaxID=103827 RepID=A0A0N5DCB0_THECL|nr:unnamed protein product [Thelazia callipaeda]
MGACMWSIAQCQKKTADRLGCSTYIIFALKFAYQKMTDGEPSDSRAEDDYEEGEEAYDDEGTLDEEELLHPEDNYQDELKLLEDDANLTVEELRQKYCASVPDEEYDDSQSTSTSDDTHKSESTDPGIASIDFTETDVSDSLIMSPERNRKGHGYFSDLDDNDEDTEYLPPGRWRRIVRQGPSYQASIPDIILPRSKSPHGERDVLLWAPHAGFPMRNLEEYLKDYYKMRIQRSDLKETRKAGNTNRGFPVRDDEDALKALLNAGYDTHAALASFPFPPANAPLKSVGPNPARWTDQDCELFERGMQMYEKNFYFIRRLFRTSKKKKCITNLWAADKLPHRTVGEIVHFYYIWKKTERHDMYQERIQKTKSQEHSNCTDLMSGLVDHMDEGSNGNSCISVDKETNAIQSRELSKDLCWEGGESSAFPHLDSDTITQVLQ